MEENVCVPKTFMNHPHQWKLKTLLQLLFADPDPDHITKKIVPFLAKHPIPINDLPLIKGTYSRTILFRSNNGFEAMAARWSPGTLSPIHGHPWFIFDFVVSGKLSIDNYKRCGDQAQMTTPEIISKSGFFSSTGTPGTFDNHIHQVKAVEETLSIHISSDDAARGKIFSRVR